MEPTMTGLFVIGYIYYNSLHLRFGYTVCSFLVCLGLAEAMIVMA